MSNNLTSNHFSWSELMTSAPKQAVEFYGQLFGWQFETMDMQGQDYFVALCDKEKIAGIMACPTPEQPPCWGQYVTVSDIQATADKVQSLNGKLLTPPTAIDGVGYFIVFQDPQGALLSAIQYEPQSGA
ncbi:VOC family protein [Planctobacterium marinum]|uniref:VOC family protein n=1 Tax=Planctobacterium marinum TaxID=1631968 RepID=UPI001E5B4031|nr:VOC family protein [Planctobacterium marinum]MCC2606900.1 VOC family protein [Planctobacterium marinum]